MSDGLLAPGGTGRKVVLLAGVALLVGAGIGIGVVIGRTDHPTPAPAASGAGPAATGAPASVPAAAPRPARAVTNPAKTVRGPKGIGEGGSLHPGGDAHAHGGVPKLSFVIDPAIAGDIKAIVKALRGAAETADPGNLNYAQDLVRKYLAGDPEKGREVVELLRAEKDLQVMDLLVGALAQDALVANDPGVIESFLQMAERGDDPNLKRESLIFLAGVQQSPAGFADRLSRLGRDDADSGVQASALQALGQYAASHPQESVAVTKDLLEVAQGAREPMVRAAALGAINVEQAGAPGLQALGGLVQRDADGGVRIAAAEALGGVRAADRGAALTVMEAAYRQEPDEAVRRSLIYNIVRAGRSDAAAALDRIAALDPKLAPDIQDYLEILKAGETDPNRIFQEKTNRDNARMPEEVELPAPGEH
ncbi:MAG: HEAT repeat domain-containing protein [Planctomycetes bacterium]|nr:HEAT repeat domain-containing protein [Planctomycetota bacterium]